MKPRRLQAGDKAFEFKLKNQNNKEIWPLSQKGSRILLSFHPLAWTSICEIQMRALEAKKAIFEDLDTIAYGISVDSVDTKREWAEFINVSETNLLADFWPHGEVAQQYGVFRENIGVSQRANVLIGPDRTIERLQVYELSEIPDIEAIIEFIGTRNA